MAVLWPPISQTGSIMMSDKFENVDSQTTVWQVISNVECLLPSFMETVELANPIKLEHLVVNSWLLVIVDWIPDPEITS